MLREFTAYGMSPAGPDAPRTEFMCVIPECLDGDSEFPGRFRCVDSSIARGDQDCPHGVAVFLTMNRTRISRFLYDHEAASVLA